MKVTEKEKESQMCQHEKILDNLLMHLSDYHVADSSSVSSLTVSDTDHISAKEEEKKKRKNLRLSENKEKDEKRIRHSLELDDDVMMSDDCDS